MRLPAIIDTVLTIVPNNFISLQLNQIQALVDLDEPVL
jgi:hypothetical protein